MCKTKTVYLHVGMHKTATSSIQVTLTKNKKRINKFDVYIPHRYNNNVPNHGVAMHSMFCTEPEKYNINIKKELTNEELQKMNNEMKNTLIKEIKETPLSKIVISGEDMSSLTEENLVSMKKFFLNIESNINIKIIFVTRDVISFCSSAAQEAVKGGLDIDEVSEKFFNKVFGIRLKKFLNVFGKDNLIVYKFEDSVKDEHGPVSYFLKKLGLTKEDINNIKIFQSNESLSDKAIEIMSYINKRFPVVVNNKLNKYRTNNDLFPFFKISGMKFIFSKKIKEAIFERQLDDIKWLNDLNIGVCYPEELILENEDDKGSELLYTELYYKEITNIIPQISSILQKICYEFFIYKVANVNNQNKVIFERLIDYMEKNYKEVIDTKLDEVYVKQEKKKEVIEGSLKKFMERYGCDANYKIAEVYRDLGMLCDQHMLHDAAFHFMDIAKLYRPKGDFINEKWDELKKKTENKT